MSDTLAFILNIGSPVLIGLIGGYLKVFLGRAIGEMRAEILEAMEEKYMTRELLTFRLDAVDDKIKKLEGGD